MTTDPLAVDYNAERYEAAALACLRSDDLTTRALDWASTHAWKHSALVESIVAWFTESPEFDLWVEDVVDGEDTP